MGGRGSVKERGVDCRGGQGDDEGTLNLHFSLSFHLGRVRG